MRVNRETLLGALESVSPGLAKREIVEQSDCFVFTGKRVITYNDEVAVQAKSPLNGQLEGAVRAAPLMTLLQKLAEDEVEIRADEAELRIKGKQKQAGVRMDAEVTLPVGSVEKPGKWTALPEGFLDALQIATQCAGKDETEFILTCVYITPKYIEASDNVQIIRCPTETGFSEPALVRAASVKHIAGLGVTHVSETKSWIHFRNKGVIFSCRRYADEYPKLGQFYKLESPRKITLPGGLGEAVEKATVFSSENTEANDILIKLDTNELRIEGRGATGWYAEKKRINYDGERMAFRVSPTLLVDITERANECQLSAGRLKVKTGTYSYVVALVDENAQAEGTE